MTTRIRQSCEKLSGKAAHVPQHSSWPQGHCQYMEHLRSVAMTNRNLVVCSNQLQLGENCTSLQSGPKALDMRNGVQVELGDVIQHSIITAWTPVSGFFISMWSGDDQLLDDG